MIHTLATHAIAASLGFWAAIALEHFGYRVGYIPVGFTRTPANTRSTTCT